MTERCQSSNQPAMPRLFVTDLDGTLLDSRACLPAPVRVALQALGEAGVVRAVATGRSLLSVRRVLEPDAPIDYLIYSSGAGVMRWPDDPALATWSMPEAAVHEASALFERERIDFMVHAPAPDSHRFGFRQLAGHPDLRARVARYSGHCWSLGPDARWRGPACQLLAIPLSCAEPDVFCARVRDALPALAVVRTTSPLDHRSLWVEVFPRDVSKARASEFLASQLGVGVEARFAVGNDYNDATLLAWAARACVVGNAPAALKARHEAVPSNDEGGVVSALRRFGLLP